MGMYFYLNIYFCLYRESKNVEKEKARYIINI